MKCAIIAVALATGASGFMAPSVLRVSNCQRGAGSLRMVDGGPGQRKVGIEQAPADVDSYGGKINMRVKLEEPIVTDKVTYKKGDKVSLCRCWFSNEFPICNNSHQQHNEATGDNVGPINVTVE